MRMFWLVLQSRRLKTQGYVKVLAKQELLDNETLHAAGIEHIIQLQNSCNPASQMLQIL